MRIMFKWVDQYGEFHAEKCSKIELTMREEIHCHFFDGDSSWEKFFKVTDLQMWEIETTDEMGYKI